MVVSLIDDNPNGQYGFLAGTLCVGVYVIFTWMLFKLCYFLLTAMLEQTSCEKPLKEAFNWIMPKSFFVKSETTLKGWKILTKHIHSLAQKNKAGRAEQGGEEVSSKFKTIQLNKINK